jgi:uncharacterized protein
VDKNSGNVESFQGFVLNNICNSKTLDSKKLPIARLKILTSFVVTYIPMEFISIIQNYLKNQPVRRGYLFGSYARGEQNENSDVDILLELDDHVGLYKFVGMQLGLENLLGKKIDLVSDKGLSAHLHPYVEKDKKLIYEKSTG